MEWLAHHSVIQYIGISQRKSSANCGYCKNISSTEAIESADDVESDDEEIDQNEKKSVCLGLGAIRIFTEHVNRLVDSGWNWSGRYLYKPIMEETCCPLYTIRLDSLNFRLSRSQKRVLRTWNEFLKFDKRPPLIGNVCSHDNKTDQIIRAKKNKNLTPPVLSGKNRQFKKKNIRKNKALQKLQEKGINIQQYQQERMNKEKARQRTLESYLWEWDETFKHKLEIKTVRVGSHEFGNTIDESFAVYEKYQKTVHQDTRCSRKGFQSFLVDSPFLPSQAENDGLPAQGSYHMNYVLDGKIIAVGVVDFLPRCLSSAYFYYDPDYAFLNLGTYSALREIEFVRRIAEKRPECHHYYMGFYVHGCRKMRYKGGFSPSELLCEKSNQWVPLPECIEMIEQNSGNFTVFCPQDPVTQGGNAWQCKPLRYHNASGSGSFEKLAMNEELADQLSLFAKYFGELSAQVYIVVT